MTTIHDFDWDDNYRVGTLERGNLRAVIERDIYPDPPYFDGGDPILDTETGEQVYGAPAPDSIREAIGYTVGAWGCREWETDIFERYVRIFHGGTVKWINGGSRGEEGRYAAIALPSLRRELGCSEEHLHTAPFTDEWTAYVEGDVFGVRVERRVEWQRIGSDGEPVFLTEPNTLRTWEYVEGTDVWGQYGEESAVEAAMEALNDVEEEAA